MEVIPSQLQNKNFLNHVIYNQSQFYFEDLVTNYDIESVVMTDYIELENKQIHSVKIRYIIKDTVTQLYFFEEEYISLKTMFEDYKITCYF